jgi:uncharacterized protein (DUF58 family)
MLVALPVSLVVVLGLASWWRKHSLDHLEYHRRFHYIRAFPGESYPVKIEVENNKFLPLTWLRLEDPWPKAVGPQDENILAPSHNQDQGFLTHVFSLRWHERARRSYELIFRKRGIYTVGPARCASGDLFGIYEQSGQVGQVERLTIFPNVVPRILLDLPPEHPIGGERSRRRIAEDPNQPIGVRDYLPEDSFRKIHWPATARTGQLQVKVFQPTSAQVMMVVLNISTYHRYWEGVYPALLEHLLSVAATLITDGIEQGFRVGMISNGCLSNSDQPFRIPPGRSPAQLTHLLSALAGVTPVVVAPFERFILKEIHNVPYGSTLLVLTAVTSPELAETLFRLKKHERRLTLLSLAEEPPPAIPGVRCVHMPFKEEAPV